MATHSNTENTELLLNDENLKAVRSWILSEKTAGQERGLRFQRQEMKPEDLARHLRCYIRAFCLRDLKVRVYNFSDRSEVWTSYEPRISKARKS